MTEPETPGPREIDETAPEGRATARAIRRGLAADPAPQDFTERVLRRCTLEGARRAAATGAAYVPPLGARVRRFAVAASIAWAWSLGLALLLADPPHRGPGLDAPLTRHPGPGDPRRGWVTLDGALALEPARRLEALLSPADRSRYRIEAYWDGEDPRAFWVVGRPAAPRPGDRYYLVDPQGIVRSEVDRVPGPKSPRYEG